MLPQRLATGATGVKQARYRRGPTRERGTRTRMRSIYKRSIYKRVIVYIPYVRRSLALLVQM